jgi:hypothetical protein
MKKILALITFLGFQYISIAQLIPSKIKVSEAKKMTKDDALKDKKVSFEITLNLISVAEATRNSIDNNDCRQTWGEVTVSFAELDAYGQVNQANPIKADFGENTFFNLPVRGPSHRSNSYYQDRRGVNDDNFIKRISVRVSENMVKNRRIVALVSCSMQTAHKDNDFASYDHLRMISPKLATFYLEDIPSKDESMSVITDGKYTIEKEVIFTNGGNSDDSHRIWLNFIIKKKT